MSGIANDITGAGQAVEGVSKLATTFEDTLFRLFPGLDKGKAADVARELEEKAMDQQAAMNAGQVEINKTEAASPNFFVAGWRPFVGWVLGAGFAWAFVVGPIFAMFIRVWKAEYALPVLDTGSLTTMLLAMLGLGGLKTVEHVTGVSGTTTGTVTTKTVKKALPV